jgi:hypothetical protein
MSSPEQKYFSLFAMRYPVSSICILTKKTFLRHIAFSIFPKGRIKPKADWRAVDSPPQKMNEFAFFAVKSKKTNKTNLFIPFWGESTARQSA